MKTAFLFFFFLISVCGWSQDDVKATLEDTTLSKNVLQKFPNADFFEDVARVYSDGKWGYINKQGEIVLPFIYLEASDFNEGLAAVKLNSKMGFIDKQGKTIIPFVYNYAGKFWNQFAIVADEKGKYSFVNKKGDLLTAFVFDNVESFNDFGFANIKISNKWGVVNTAGKLIVPAISKYPVDLRGDKGSVATEKETYFVNGKGQKIK